MVRLPLGRGTTVAQARSSCQDADCHISDDTQGSGHNHDDQTLTGHYCNDDVAMTILVRTRSIPKGYA